MENGHEVSILLNGGLRHDFNKDLQNLSGFEVGGGLGYKSPNRRFRAMVKGRMLATTDADYSEWGMSGGIYLDPAPEGGFSAKVEPVYGSHQSGVQDLWSNGIRSLQANRDLNLPVQVQYKKGEVAPYLRLLNGKPYFGLSFKSLSLEGVGGEAPGIGIRGEWIPGLGFSRSQSFNPTFGNRMNRIPTIPEKGRN